MRRTLIRQQSVGGVVNRPALVTPGRRDIFEMETVQVRWHRNIVRVMRGLVRRSFTVNVNDARVNGEMFFDDADAGDRVAFFCGRGCGQYPAAGVSLSTRFLRYL